MTKQMSKLRRGLIFWTVTILVSTIFSTWATWLQSRELEQVCVNEQVITSVQAVGHKNSTTYYVLGDKGGKAELDYIVKTGDKACFKWEKPMVDRKPFVKYIREDLL